MNFHIKNQQDNKLLFPRAGFWIIALWILGLLLGCFIAVLLMDSHAETIDSLHNTRCSLWGTIIHSLSLFVLPSIFKYFSFPYRGLIYILAFGRGLISGYFLLSCLFFSPEIGWLTCLLLQFFFAIVNVLALDYWTSYLSLNADLSFLIQRCVLLVVALLVDALFISPLVIRIF